MEEYVKISKQNYDALVSRFKKTDKLYEEIIDELEKDDATIHIYSGCTTRFIFSKDEVVIGLMQELLSLRRTLDELSDQNELLRRRKWYKFW